MHGDCGSMYVEREYSGEGLGNDVGFFDSGGIPRSVGGTPKFKFLLGSGDKGSKAQRKVALGPLRKKGRPVSNFVSSPGDQKPRKRSRNEEKDLEPGFGFVGFTSRSN
ncbi:hypothetical protein Hanom_Chr17g01569941 [Helianthus anomalus]